jgi:hypothetical protein
MSEHIGGFLDFFRKKLASKLDERDEIRQYFENRFKTTFKDSDFKIQNTTLYITCRPIIKSEIMINKSTILKEVGEMLKKYNKIIIDIR